MNLYDHEIIQVRELLARIKPQSASYLDLTGQPDNSSTTPTGKIGEFVSGAIEFDAPVSLTTNVDANVTSISLTPGDWDVWGIVYFSGGATTIVTNLVVSVSPTSATQNTGNGRWASEVYASETIFSASRVPSLALAQTRFILSATTTYYLTARASFTVSTCTAYGIIQARRRRHFPG